jgi:hypothetical protein
VDRVWGMLASVVLKWDLVRAALNMTCKECKHEKRETFGETLHRRLHVRTRNKNEK